MADRHRRRRDRGALRRVPVDAIRPRHRGRRREPGGGELARLLAGQDRHGQLGCRRRARRPRWDTGGADPVPQRRRARVHGAAGPGGGTRRLVPLVLAHVRRRDGDRCDRVGTQPIHRRQGRTRPARLRRRPVPRHVRVPVGVPLGGVPRDRRPPRRARAGAAVAERSARSAARRRHRPGQRDRGGGRRRGDGADPADRPGRLGAWRS